MKLETRYANAKNSIGFAGRNIISRYSKKLSGEKLRKKLSHIPTYVLHREAKRPRTYNPTILYHPRKLLQADLIDMQARASSNQGFKYIFIVVDCFTRFCWATAVKNKTSSLILDEFKKIYKKTGKFKRFMTDRGSEFISEQFQTFLEKQGIEFAAGNPHAPHVERLNRTIQNRLFKYMTENETNRWKHILQTTIQAYNSRYHRMIKMTPAQAEMKKNHSKVLANVSQYYEKAIRRKKKPKFQVGDTVSMQKEKSVFGKGYTQVFTDELFKILKVHINLPIPMYTLVDYDYDPKKPETLEDKIVHGRFYENELQEANYEVFKVASSKPEVREGISGKTVSWKGWPARYDSWIPDENVVREYGK